jgi:para-nitrobenzyl esterase
MLVEASARRLLNKMKISALVAVMTALVACGGGGGGGGDGGNGGPGTGTSACTPVAGAATERVMTTVGVVHGLASGATWSYRKIPYAVAPIGDQRLRPTQAAGCSSSEIDATQLGPRCPQLDDNNNFIGDEDCLHLNVWAPAAAASPRPVMVWIHGGGNSVGSAVDPLYDGRRLAEVGDVIVVTANYRLGQLGFLAHTALETEQPGGGPGNYGILDQREALRWVRNNIAAFGGDPNNVTIFGESAGGRDVCTLVGTPSANGLFHRAIMQSGACKFLPTKTMAENQGASVASAAGCGADVPACLRAMTAEALVRTLPGDPSALGSSPYQPTIDGIVLIEQPSAAMAAGRHNRVPFMVGANADETAAVAPAVPNAATYDALIQAQYGVFANQVLQQYPATRFSTPRATYVRVTTDSRFVCPAREIARAADAGQTEPVYRYFFQYSGASPFGAPHGIDVPFVFGTFDAVLTHSGQPYQPTPTDLAVSAAMQNAWTHFARSADPGTTPAWPQWTPSDPVLVIDSSLSTTTGVRTADCDFWQPLYDAF